MHLAPPLMFAGCFYNFFSLTYMICCFFVAKYFEEPLRIHTLVHNTKVRHQGAEIIHVRKKMFLCTSNGFFLRINVLIIYSYLNIIFEFGGGNSTQFPFLKPTLVISQLSKAT